MWELVSKYWWFLGIVFIIGSWVGMIAAALCVAAKRGDEQLKSEEFGSSPFGPPPPPPNVIRH